MVHEFQIEHPETLHTNNANREPVIFKKRFYNFSLDNRLDVIPINIFLLTTGITIITLLHAYQKIDIKSGKRHVHQIEQDLMKDSSRKALAYPYNP